MRKFRPSCCWLFGLSLFLWNGVAAQPGGAKLERSRRYPVYEFAAHDFQGVQDLLPGDGEETLEAVS